MQTDIPRRYASRILSAIGIALLSAAGPVRAQAPPPTLAAGLNALPDSSFSSDQLLITVQPDQVSHLGDPSEVADGQQAQPDLITLDSVLRYFGQATRDFGRVTAVAPATMAVLAPHPAPLQLTAANLPMDEGLKHLLGSLTAEQLQQLGTRGLGVDDLSELQRDLFMAALNRPLPIAPANVRPPEWDPARMDHAEFAAAMDAYKQQTKLLPPEALTASRLHANLMPQYIFPMPGGDARVFAYRSDSHVPEAFQYVLSTAALPVDRSGPVFRRVTQNMPKSGDLALDDAAFEKVVSLDGVKTVGDLIKQVASVSAMELFCDPHYASQTLVEKGNRNQSLPARDLLQAVGLCLTATWRKVGPAYVLTDDIEGVAARRRRIRDVVADWNASLAASAHDTGRRLAAARWYASLPIAADDPGALPDDLVASLAEDPAAKFWGGDLPFRSLPPAVQADLRGRLQSEQQQYPDAQVMYADTGGAHTTHMTTRQDEYRRILAALDGDYTLTVDLECRFFVDVPGLGTLALDTGKNIFFVPFAHAAPEAAATGKPSANLPSPEFLAVIAGASNATDAVSVVDTVSALGVKTLYCPVFIEGRAYLQNTAIPAADADAASVLKAAVAEGAKRGVAVLALVDALRWAGSRPGAVSDVPLQVAPDLTITGHAMRLPAASPDGDTRQSHIPASTIDATERRWLSGVWVSPADITVGKSLRALVEQAARTPGLAGVAIEDTMPPGYEAASDRTASAKDGGVSFGYNPELRLAFLRARHADPIDFDELGGASVLMRTAGGSDMGSRSLDISLPVFDRNSGLDQTLSAAWSDYRNAQTVALTNGIVETAAASAVKLPLYVRTAVHSGARFERLAVPIHKDTAASPAYATDPEGRLDVVTYDPAHPEDAADALSKPKAAHGAVIDMTAPGVDLKRDLTAILKGSE